MATSPSDPRTAAAAPVEQRQRRLSSVFFVAGGLPLLLVGWLGSALANRLSFAVWGCLAAVVYAAFLRSAGRNNRQLSGVAAALLCQAMAWAGFGWLAARHAEILDLARRAWRFGWVVSGGATSFFILAIAAAVLAVFFFLRQTAQRARTERASSPR